MNKNLLEDILMPVCLTVIVYTFVLLCTFIMWFIISIIQDVNQKKIEKKPIKHDICACQLVEDIDQDHNWKNVVKNSQSC